ncbi:MAG: type III-A CRISPR-associated RAMP protein Csm4 [candidate division WOR-3 bacterium]
MINLKIFKLKFKSPLHVGADSTLREKVEVIIHSDTLYSALYDLSIRVGSRIREAILERKILLSSAFPYYEDENERIYFLPRPIYNVKGAQGKSKEDFELSKKFKKLDFIPSDWLNSIDNLQKNIGNGFSKYSDLLKEIYAVDILPKVFVDRFTSASTFYRMGQVFFYKGGLYFIVKFLSEGLEGEFRGLLKLLGEEGIGGKRSTGSGTFEFEEDALTFEMPESPNFYLLLSLSIPVEGEMDGILKNSYYELILRRGWFLTDEGYSRRRKSVWMLKEGSILHKDIKGCAVDVTPEALYGLSDSKIYKFAYAFTLPVRLNHE